MVITGNETIDNAEKGGWHLIHIKKDWKDVFSRR